MAIKPIIFECLPCLIPGGCLRGRHTLFQAFAVAFSRYTVNGNTGDCYSPAFKNMLPDPGSIGYEINSEP